MTIVSVIQGNLYLQRNRQIFKPFFHRAFSYFCGGYGIIAEVQQNRIISHTTQVDNGSQVFSVKTKRIQWEGQDAFIEYATDITAVSRAQQIFETQLHALLSSIPEAQGVFHLNLTQDQVLTMTGTSSNVEPLKTLLQVDALVESVASFIPDNAMRQQFLQRFRRKPLQQAYRNGKSELQQELLSYYDDKSIRWTRMTARLIANPNTGDLEAILYGMDISREKNYEARIASAQQEKSALLELAQQDPLTGLYSKTAFAEKTQAFLDSTPAAPFALIFMDLDYFKTINDTLGHLAGDLVLCDVTRQLQQIFGADSLLSRFGGDEFCILLHRCTATPYSSWNGSFSRYSYPSSCIAAGRMHSSPSATSTNRMMIPAPAAKSSRGVPSAQAPSSSNAAGHRMHSPTPTAMRPQDACTSAR